VKHIGLFEGIGGFSLAARWMGWETLAWCEWNEFGQRVLKHHFPEAEGFGDITKTDFTKYANRIDILTGGFPCQPYSLAGKRKGKADDRHLWPEMLRAIREIQPTWVVGENVFGLINWDGGLVFDEVQADLEAAGYEVWPYVLPACAVNAPHRRDRVWFVAYCNHSRNTAPSSRTNGKQSEESIERQQPQLEHCGFSTTENATNPDSIRLQQRKDSAEMARGQAEMGRQGSEPTNAFEANGEVTNATHPSNQGLQRGKVERGTGEFGQKRNQQLAGCLPSTWQNFPTQPPICGGDDGLPSELDGITFSKWRNESIKAYGNAIVPQVAFQIFKAIKELTHTAPH